ncbi:flagellar basal-body rod protein FlgG [Desulfosalsimonas propionicica]|uniref:Flagellar basal-body rod protein FlgG n=1 Tax=Desulfosalsimonas propionicica TaxID=332175 RepID=A0A7W0C8Z0_9BACT|nr:flagellar basal-body rod protein FlgG [Desulfosalsimonas propionicica]MBA2881322.1 flagellar basal-body rod protein FlgG [Desulfosalsimonas propionicica]
MITALYSAATGMEAQETNINVVANNLANVNTTGFKRSRANFQDLLYQNARAVGSAATADTQVPTGIQVGLGTRTASVEKVHTVGDLQRTGNDLDMAIEGNGFFQVEQPDGETAYTRDGSFKKDSEGRLVTADGNPVIPEIVIPENATKIAVGQDGTVTAFLDSEAAGNEIGTIELARFGNPAGLISLGNNLLQQSDASGDPILGEAANDGFGGIAQGFLEGSNVSIMQEMIDLISGQRAYEVNSKAVKAADEILQQTTQLLA